ncbi:hypothetical protein U9K47_15460 [Bacillus toyonensis]|uniref:hypothetical protein n=1 Tax=Bacillus toyonensis TaxID=155322 RepID=UPI0034659711
MYVLITIAGAAMIWWASCLLLRKDKGGREMWGPTTFKDVLEFFWEYKWYVLKRSCIPFLIGLGTGWLIWG